MPDYGKPSLKRMPWDDDDNVPEKPKRKQDPPISFRFSKEVIDFFRKDGPGWQSRMHTVLINYVRERKGK